jgi:hypothetical protein
MPTSLAETRAPMKPRVRIANIRARRDCRKKAIPGALRLVVPNITNCVMAYVKESQEDEAWLLRRVAKLEAKVAALEAELAVVGLPEEPSHAH